MVAGAAVGAEGMEAVWAEEMVQTGVETILSTLDQTTMGTRMVTTKAGRMAVVGMAGMVAAVVVMEGEEEIPMLKTHINLDLIRVSLRSIHMVEVVATEAVTADMVDTVMVVEAEAMADMVATRGLREDRLKTRMAVEVEMVMVHPRHLH